jgi:CRP/FNR family cyclic AMP-dependent transcriptional regulator
MKLPGSKQESDIVVMLQNVPLFSALETKELRHIADSFKEHRYEANQVIEGEGEKGVSFFLIKDGQVWIKKGNKTLANLGPGKFFGEMALLDGKPRSATAMTGDDPATCLVITSWAWEGFLKTKPEIAIALLKEVATRLRETDKKLTE